MAPRHSLIALAWAAVALAAAAQPAARAPTERPNVLLIQADDLGCDDLSLHGNPVVDTRHLDQLGRASVRFDQFYVQHLCAPSRAALLTGRHYLRTGVSGVHGGRDYLHLGETLLPEVLRDAGYATGMWGKWHSGKTDGYFPWDRGFDEAYYASLYNEVEGIPRALVGLGHTYEERAPDRGTFGIRAKCHRRGQAPPSGSIPAASTSEARRGKRRRVPTASSATMSDRFAVHVGAVRRETGPRSELADPSAHPAVASSGDGTSDRRGAQRRRTASAGRSTAA